MSATTERAARLTEKEEAEEPEGVDEPEEFPERGREREPRLRDAREERKPEVSASSFFSAARAERAAEKAEDRFWAAVRFWSRIRWSRRAPSSSTRTA